MVGSGVRVGSSVRLSRPSKAYLKQALRGNDWKSLLRLTSSSVNLTHNLKPTVKRSQFYGVNCVFSLHGYCSRRCYCFVGVSSADLTSSPQYDSTPLGLIQCWWCRGRRPAAGYLLYLSCVHIEIFNIWRWGALVKLTRNSPRMPVIFFLQKKKLDTSRIFQLA